MIRRRTVAVTGANGFIGRRVMERLADRGDDVVAIDVRQNGHPGTVLLDIRDDSALASLFAEHAVTHVVHCSAVAGVEAVKAAPVVSASVNVVGAESVLAAAEAQGIVRVIDLSSEEVYGAPTGEAIHEEAPLTPVTAYGVQKAAIEGLASTRPGSPYIAARMSWIYGTAFPRARPPQPWIDDAARKQPSGVAIGADHRADLLHVDDAVSAILALLDAEDLRHRAYNVGSGTAVTLSDVAELLHRLEPHWSVELQAGYVPGIQVRPPLSISRISTELGWRPDLSLEEGLRRTLHGR